MLLLFLIVGVVISSAIDQCIEKAGEVWKLEKNLAPNSTDYEVYCYKDMGKHTIYDGVEICENWKPEAKVASIHSAEEWNFWKTDILPSIGAFYTYVGLVKKEIAMTCSNEQDSLYWFDESEWDTYTSTLVTTAPNPPICTDDTQNCLVSSSVLGTPFRFADELCHIADYHVICRYKHHFCDYPADDILVCSGHGKCEGTDYCVCDPDYSGLYCNETHTCGGVRHDNETVCGGRGNCTSPDLCLCETGFYGDNCEMVAGSQIDCNEIGDEAFLDFCYHKYSSGLNFDLAQADCESKGGNLLSFHDLQEENFARDKFGLFMIGLRKNDSNVDGKNPFYWTDGTDTEYSKKRKDRGLVKDTNSGDKCFGFESKFYWTDRSCSSTDLPYVCKRKFGQCGTRTAQDPLQCYQRGKCTSSNTCDCSNGYTGNECENWECFGIPHDASVYNSDLLPCSGHGTCFGPNSCACEPNYFGKKCSITSCFNMTSTEPKVCSGHGECKELDNCVCDWGFGTEDCALSYPNSDFLELYSGKIEWDGAYDIPSWDYKVGMPRNWVYYATTDYTTEGKDAIHVEKYAKEVWYKGKGRIYPIFLSQNTQWIGDYRDTIGTPTYIHDIFIGPRKIFTTPPWDDCYAPGYVCIANYPFVLDPCSASENTDYLTGELPNPPGTWECTRPAICMLRPRSGNPPYDGACANLRNWAIVYELHYCNDILEDNPSVCSGNGFCWADDVCTCKGTGYGYNQTDYCSTRFCGGVESNETWVCGGHGECIDNNHPQIGICDCQEGYWGEHCNVTRCFGLYSNNTEGEAGLQSLVCSGHGECVGPDTCSCSSDYFGERCNGTYCVGFRSDSPKVCGGHGECVVKDWCDCESSDYPGKFCQYTRFSCSSCSSYADCTPNGNCSCFPGYFGEKCDVTTCADVLSNETDKVCGGDGVCFPKDVCSCTESEKYYGLHCNKPICSGIKAENTSHVCNGGKGTCIAPDQCKCFNELDWTGPNCNEVGPGVLFTCYGFTWNDTSKVCSGKGSCDAPNVCHCDQGFYGKECSVTMCNDVLTNSTDPKVCSGKGTCSGPDNCTCNYGVTGSNCESLTSCFGVSETEDSSCTTNGKCVGLNLCECNEKYYGRSCFEYVPTAVATVVGATWVFPYIVNASSLTGKGLVMNEETSCSTFFTEYRKDGEVANWFGSDPKCTPVVEEGEAFTSSINLEPFLDAPVLTDGLYEFDFKVQTSDKGETFTYTYQIGGGPVGPDVQYSGTLLKWLVSTVALLWLLVLHP